MRLIRGLAIVVLVAFDAFTAFRLVQGLVFHLPRHPSGVFWAAIGMLGALAIAVFLLVRKLIGAQRRRAAEVGR